MSVDYFKPIYLTEEEIKDVPSMPLNFLNSVVDGYTLEEFLKDEDMNIIKKKLPCVLLLLPDDNSTNGHYVALAQNKEKTILYYFDSFGYNPLDLWKEHPKMIGEKQNIDKWGEFLKSYEKVIYNEKKIQNETSNLCGYYCITYIYEFYSRSIEFTPEIFVSTLQLLKNNYDLSCYDNVAMCYYLSVLTHYESMFKKSGLLK